MTLSLVLFALALKQDALPERDVAVNLPITQTPVFGRVRSSEALAFLRKLYELGRQLAPEAKLQPVDQLEKEYRVVYSRRHVGCFWTPVSSVFSPTTGKLIRFGFAQLSGDPQPNVGLDECARRAKLFYRLAGGRHQIGDPIHLTSKPDDFMVNINFEILAPGEEHPVGDPVECVFDRTYGLPLTIQVAEPPEYEKAARVQKVFDCGQAAASAAIQLTGWECVEVGAQKPRYVIPDYRNLPNAMTERHGRLEKERKACLVYEISVNDSSSFNEAEKHYERFVQVYVDAETGVAIAALPAYLMIGSPSTAQRPVDVAGKEWKCGATKGKLAQSENRDAAVGKNVMLSAGDQTWMAGKYDGKTNALFVKFGTGWAAFVPDKALAAALKSYKPSAFASQPPLVKPKKASK